ncbi:hypothetical protein CYJ61_02255 [Gardnerella leopoldii]|uniref:Uncharacterized protein n=1 Tax=Gardnerella vaginalis TaxID=2702 RepID=A0AAP8LSH5_GARVA|nr:hypothetical protein CYJ61_02255 [Gardnerella vaginalis]
MFLVIKVVFVNPYYFQTFYLKVIRMWLAILQILSNIYTQAMLEEAYALESKASHQERITIKT